MNPIPFDPGRCCDCSCTSDEILSAAGCPYNVPGLRSVEQPPPADEDDQAQPLTNTERVHLLGPALLVIALVVAVASCAMRWAR